MEKHPDDLLQKEIDECRKLINHCEMVNAPHPVIDRYQFTIDVMNELLQWRKVGRKWLEIMNGKDQNAGKVQPSERLVNEVSARTGLQSEG